MGHVTSSGSMMYCVNTKTSPPTVVAYGYKEDVNDRMEYINILSYIQSADIVFNILNDKVRCLSWHGDLVHTLTDEELSMCRWYMLQAKVL